MYQGPPQQPPPGNMQCGYQQRPPPRNQGYYGAAPQFKRRESGRTVRGVFWTFGTFVLILVSVLPIWNAIQLMKDFNYTFWFDYTVPLLMITGCIGVICLYLVTIPSFFTRLRPHQQTEAMVLSIATVFLTFFGLLLLVLSFALCRQSNETSHNLMDLCDSSPQTRPIYNYAQVLQRIRELPICANTASIEDCAGFETAEPYTNYLKALEKNYDCSGFCFRKAVTLDFDTLKQAEIPLTVGSNSTPKDAATAQKAAASGEKALLQRTRGYTSSNMTALSHQFGKGWAQVIPPPLFSSKKPERSCEGMAARSLSSLSSDIGYQTFYQGLFLVASCIVSGLLRSLSYLVHHKGEYVQLYAADGRPVIVAA